MTGKQQLGVVAAVAAAACIALFAIMHFLGDEISPLGTGKKAPDFSAFTLDDAQHTKTLADYRGKVVLLNIWATWCGPCRQEMPSMEALHREFAPQGLSIVAISIDDGEMREGVRDFAKDFGLTFEILHDPPGTIQRTYQTTGVPESILIGRDGVIRHKVAGAVDWTSDNYRKLIQQLVAE